MALFPQHANGSGDSLLWMKFNELVMLLNRWAAKVWTSNNDGTGSGLDADTLDSRHGTAFAYSEVCSTADLDTVIQSGMYRIETNANRPTGTAYGQLLVMHGAGDTITQICTDYSSTAFWWRSGNPAAVGGTGVWNAWKKVWNEGNDGSGSGLDADTVDGVHYEEGAFGTAPELRGTGTAGTWAYTTQLGYYTKIGKLVYVDITLKPSSISGSPTGDAQVLNMPFTSASTNQMFPVISSGVDFSAGYTGLYALVVSGGTDLRLYQYGDNVAFLALPVGAILATDEIRIAGTYRTA